MEHDRQLIVATQLDENEDNPEFDDVYQTGTLVKVQQLLRMPGGLVRILVNGISRVQLQGFSQKDKYMEAAAVEVEEITTDETEGEALRRLILERFAEWLDNMRNSEEVIEKARSITDPWRISRFYSFANAVETHCTSADAGNGE
jgi:ATP-dependent Lon protease